jgi:hypothetical protein
LVLGERFEEFRSNEEGHCNAQSQKNSVGDRLASGYSLSGDQGDADGGADDVGREKTD